jgi:magnesium-transporting ATPase (P-type)
MAINFCAMAVSVIAPVLNIDTPITVVQMLWLNLVMDTLAGLAFGGERSRAEYMREPPKKRGEPIINRYMWRQILVVSLYATVLSLWFLKSPFIDRAFFPRGERYKMSAFFTLFIFLALFNGLNARTHKINLLDYLALNKPFVFIMGGIAVLQVLLIYFGGGFFGTERLNIRHLALILGLAFSVIPLDLIRKTLSKEGAT